MQTMDSLALTQTVTFLFLFAERCEHTMNVSSLEYEMVVCSLLPFEKLQRCTLTFQKAL